MIAKFNEKGAVNFQKQVIDAVTYMLCFPSLYFVKYNIYHIHTFLFVRNLEKHILEYVFSYICIKRKLNIIYFIIFIA